MFNSILPYWYALILTSGLFQVVEMNPQLPAKTPALIQPAPELPYGRPRGNFGPVTIGPSLGIGLPHVINVGLESRYRQQLGLAANYGFIPGIAISGTTVAMNSYDLRFRWFIFKKSFFVGAAYGVQNLTASTTQKLQGIPVNANVDISTTYFSPHLGWRWQWASGFFTGMDLGVQIACATNTSVSTDVTNALVLASDDYQKVVKQVTDQGNDLGRTRLPFATLFEIGYLF